MVDSLTHRALEAIRDLAVKPYDGALAGAKNAGSVRELANGYRNAPVVLIDCPWPALDYDALISTGLDFFQNDVLPFPDNDFIIEARTVTDDWETEVRYINFVHLTADGDGFSFNAVRTNPFEKGAPFWLVPYCGVLSRSKVNAEGPYLQTNTSPDQRRNLDTMVGDGNGGFCAEQDDVLRVSLNMIMGGLALLTTRDAAVHHHPAPEKLNKKRREKGRFEIPEKQHVRLRPWQTEAGPVDFNAAGPSRSSSPKRPHWRRGHVRRLSDGRLTRVAPTIVGVDPAFREEAKARMPAPEYRING